MEKTRDWQLFIGLMGSLAEVFQRELKHSTAELYWGALEDLEMADFRVSVGKIIQAWSFFPKPAELREIAEEVQAVRRAANQRKLRQLEDAGSRDFTEDERWKDIWRHWRPDPQCRVGCTICAFAKAHPAQHLHLRGNLTCADIDCPNAPRVDGCCGEGR